MIITYSNDRVTFPMEREKLTKMNHFKDRNTRLPTDATWTKYGWYTSSTFTSNTE